MLSPFGDAVPDPCSSPSLAGSTTSLAQLSGSRARAPDNSGRENRVFNVEHLPLRAPLG